MRRPASLIPFIALGLIPALHPRAQAQDAIAEELTTLMQKMSSADDPCPYLPKLRELINRLANSDADVYNAMKPMLDEINKEPDQPCGSSARNASSPAARMGKKAAPNSGVDVRYTTADTRSLTDDEARVFLNGLHWSPEVSTLTRGGTAQSTLLDAQGRKMASIRIRWDRVEAPPYRPHTAAGPNVAFFTIALENTSSCVFTSRASLQVPGDIGPVYTTIDWFGWVNLKEPGSGRSDTFQVSQAFGRDAATLQFRPDNPANALSQCRTPEVKP